MSKIIEKLRKLEKSLEKSLDKAWDEGCETGYRDGYKDGVMTTKRDVGDRLREWLPVEMTIDRSIKKRERAIKAAIKLGYADGVSAALDELEAYAGENGDVYKKRYVNLELDVDDVQAQVLEAIIHEGELRARDNFLSLLKSRMHWDGEVDCACLECVELRKLTALVSEMIQ